MASGSLSPKGPASAVAQPAVQFVPNASERAYFKNTNLYIGSETLQSDSSKDFSAISPYHAVLYWRFLYECCSGLTGSAEDPAAGLRFIRSVLVNLYQGVGTGSTVQSTSLDILLLQIIDAVLAGSSCPFQTYAQSLTTFSQSIASRGSENSRCDRAGFPDGCSLYDPYALYNSPVSDEIALIDTQP